MGVQFLLRSQALGMYKSALVFWPPASGFYRVHIPGLSYRSGFRVKASFVYRVAVQALQSSALGLQAAQVPI